MFQLLAVGACGSGTFRGCDTTRIYHCLYTWTTSSRSSRVCLRCWRADNISHLLWGHCMLGLHSRQCRSGCVGCPLKCKAQWILKISKVATCKGCSHKHKLARSKLLKLVKYCNSMQNSEIPMLLYVLQLCKKHEKEPLSKPYRDWVTRVSGILYFMIIKSWLV